MRPRLSFALAQAKCCGLCHLQPRCEKRTQFSVLFDVEGLASLPFVDTCCSSTPGSVLQLLGRGVQEGSLLSILEGVLAGARAGSKVHRLRRVRRACNLQINAQAQGAQTLSGQACLQVPPYAQAQGAQALTGACKGTGSRCTGPSGSSVLAVSTHLRCTGPCMCPRMHRLKVHRNSLVRRPSSVDAAGPSPYCSTDRRGSCARRPRFSRCRRFSSGQVPIDCGSCALSSIALPKPP